MEYYEHNRRSVGASPASTCSTSSTACRAGCCNSPYDLLNRINRRRLLRQNEALTTSIRMDDYRIAPAAEGCFDLFFIATK